MSATEEMIKAQQQHKIYHEQAKQSMLTLLRNMGRIPNNSPSQNFINNQTGFISVGPEGDKHAIPVNYLKN